MRPWPPMWGNRTVPATQRAREPEDSHIRSATPPMAEKARWIARRGLRGAGRNVRPIPPGPVSQVNTTAEEGAHDGTRGLGIHRPKGVEGCGRN